MKKIIALIMLITLLTLVGCQEQSEKLKVGVVVPLTGAGASLGNDFVKGFEIAYENEGSDFEYFIEDSKSNPKDGVVAAQKLININDVDVLVSLQSAVVMSLVEIAEQNDVPLIATAIARDDFAKDSEYTFRMYPAASVEGKLAADYSEGIYEKVAVLTLNDAFGNSFRDEFVKNYENEVVYQEDFLISNVDYSTQITKIKESGAEAIYFIGYPPHFINFYEQKTELNLDIPVISTTHLRSNYVKSNIQSLYLENDVSTTPEVILKNSNTEEFMKTFEEKYNVKTDWNAPFGHDIVIVLDNVEKGNELGSLYDLNVNGLIGNIDFDENGEMEIPLTIIQASTDKVLI